VTTVTRVSQDLPRSRAADQNTDPAAVMAFVDQIDADPAIELHSLMVLRHGHVVAEGWWAPHTDDRARQLYSLSKSFTSTAVAFALQEGLFGLDDTVVSHFPEFADDITDRRSRSITLRHLAIMASGHDREMWHEATALDPQHPVRGFLMVPPDEPPGTLFAYSQPCTYTLASIIQRAAGTTLTEYLRPRLFDPLGIGDVGWQTWSPGGPELGFSGLFARTEDVAKLGLLYLRRGRWGDTQLIPESWVSQATRRQIATPDEGRENWSQGYGFQLWMSRHGYRGDGAFGQFCVVLPEQDAVVGITAGTRAMQGVLDHVWNHLLPGLGTETPDAGPQSDLDQRLQGLSLPPFVAKPGPRRAEDSVDGPYSVERAVEDPETALLTTIELQRRGQHREVTVTERGNALTFPVGEADWLTSVPRDQHGNPIAVSASAGWLDDDTLRVEAIFLESPHRIDITCTLASRTATAIWRNGGGGTLETLHRPA
jgi:CubicO group peptidase (beta-lactamase class C family)